MQALGCFHTKPSVCFSEDRHCLKHTFLWYSVARLLPCRNTAKAPAVQWEADHGSSAFSSSSLVSSSVCLLFAHYAADVTPEFAQPGWYLSPCCRLPAHSHWSSSGQAAGPRRGSSVTGRLKTRESPALPVAHCWGTHQGRAVLLQPQELGVYV